jgi:hypothetical protein
MVEVASSILRQASFIQMPVATKCADDSTLGPIVLGHGEVGDAVHYTPEMSPVIFEDIIA